MKSVLISIQPKWCELIANGKKTIEVRKTKPKLETPFKVYIYCTKDKDFTFCTDNSEQYTHIGNGKVIGEFVCDIVYKTEPVEETQTVIRHYPRLWWYNGADDCLHHAELENYLRWKVGYGWHISNLVIYDKPRELYNFKKPCNNDCDDCEYLDVAEVGAWEHTAIAKTCLNFITRPPQSWCYVESEVEGE